MDLRGITNRLMAIGYKLGIVDADKVLLTDAGNRFAAEDAENALQEIAGAGRTSETVKGNADNLGTHSGLQTAGVHGSTSAATASKLVHRDASGRAQVEAPSAAADIARKDTVDSHAALTAEGIHGSTVAATASKLVHRDASGRAQVAGPSAAADIARKDTVDAVQTNLNTHTGTQTAGLHGSTVAATASKLVHRDASGRAQIASPSADADIANKGWVRDFIYPVGSYYTQYPDAQSNTDATEFPTSQRPATLFGGTWVEQWPTESIYFRTRGTLSDTGRASGKQEDQFQGHWHRIGGQLTNMGNIGTYAIGSALDTTTTTGDRTGRGYPGNSYADDVVRDPKSDGSNGTPRTGAETRVVNRRIKVWKRTA